MTATTSDSVSPALSPSQLVKALIRRYRLRSGARVLDVGDGSDVVSCFRSRGVTAFALFDGHAAPRDPYQSPSAETDVPESQPAVLHQSVPFPAQSFDLVLLRDSEVYDRPLSSPEVCTATANLLAVLKPGRPLVFLRTNSLDAVKHHLSHFPGTTRRINLGSGGLEGLFRLVLGRRSVWPVLETTVPAQPISRLEWHRIARQVVMASERQPAA